MQFPLFDLDWMPLISGFAAFFWTALLTPFVIRVAYRRKWIAQPKKDRWHERPTALMGGIALYASSTLAIVLFYLESMPWPVWLGATVMFVTGLIDDFKTIRPGGKLVAQVVATGLLLMAGYSFGEGLPFWLVIPLTFFWTIGITNAVNLLDNMDGLAAGISAIAALILSVFAFLAGNLVGAALGLVVAGSAAGFLIYNFKPARIFMGDSGSMFLGYCIASLAVMIQSDTASISPFAVYIVSAMVMVVPIFDTTLVTLVRTLAGRAISQGGRDHSSHRLVFLGLSEKRAVLTLYSISFLFGVVALLFQFTEPRLFYALFMFMAVGITVFGIYLASVDVYRMRDDLGYFSTRAYLLNGKFFSVLHAFFGRNWKASFGVVADLLLLVAAFIVAHFLRYESGMSVEQKAALIRVLPVVVSAKIGVFYFMGLYRSIWRHAGTPEFLRVVRATILSSVLTYGLLLVLESAQWNSLAVLLIDGMITLCVIAGVRFGFRALRQSIASQRKTGQRVLLYGAGDAGALVIRELRQNAELGLIPIGFLDDDPLKHGMTIQGLRVLGSFRDLSRIISEHQPEAILVTAFRMTEARKTEICVECTRFDIECLAFQMGIDALPAWPAIDDLVDAETNGTH